MSALKKLSIRKETISTLSGPVPDQVAGGHPRTGDGLPRPITDQAAITFGHLFPCTRQRTGCHTVSIGPC